MTTHSLSAMLSAAVAATAISAYAQTPTPTTKPDQQPRSAQSPITVTGCLKPWDQSMGTLPREGSATAPSTGAAGSAAAGTRYVLTDVQNSGSSTGTPSTPSTSTPSMSAQTGARRYVLAAGSGVNLAGHVHHTVRVTGTLDQSSMAGDRATTGQGGESSEGRMGAGASGPLTTLTATSVTMVNATCSATK